MLAPLLFLMYISDLPACIHNQIKLYTDDVFLYSHINSVADCFALQQDLDSLAQWSHSWLMTFNPQKCEFLRITNKKNPIIHNYYIENSLIYEVPHTKLILGVTVDRKLPWNEHIWKIANKAVQANAFLYRNLRHCPINIKCTCHKSMVWSIVEYTLDPHTTTNITKLKLIQRAAARFCNFCFNDFSRQSSVTAMLTSLDLPTLQSRRMRAKLTMTYKIINYLVSIPKVISPDPPLRRGFYKQLFTGIDSYKFSCSPL